jgi:hypothetical protein
MLINQWQPIQKYIDDIVELLRSETPTNLGNLRNSMMANVVSSKEGPQIQIEMDYYGKFVDEGVNGVKVKWGSPYSFTNKRPPASAFESYTTNLSEQFAIAASVYNNGIQPRDFIQPVIDEKLQGLSDLIANSIWDNLFNERNKKEITIKIW